MSLPKEVKNRTFKRLDFPIVSYPEMEIVSNSLWLAAGLTIKGDYDEGVKRGFPYIRVRDRLHNGRIGVLSRLYGNDSQQDGVWEVRRERALWLMNLCSSGLPSRRGSITKEDVDADVPYYKNLLRFKRYPAGIVDFAACFYIKRNRERVCGLKMCVQTTKLNLLLALRDEYFGTVRRIREKGRKVGIGDSNNIIKRDIWAWELGHRDTLNLLRDVREYLLVADITVKKLVTDEYIYYNSSTERRKNE